MTEPSPILIAELERRLEELAAENSALKEANEELEQWMADRTGELAQANRQLRLEVAERKRAAGELRAGAARYRAFFDNAAAGIDVVDTEGRFIHANAALCAFLGYTEEELRGMRILDVTHPDDRMETAENLQALTAGEIPRFHYEKRFVTKDGRVAWADVSATAVRSPEGKHELILGVVTDTTHRKRAEEELRKSIRTVQAIFNASTDPVFLLDSTCTIVAANEALARRLNRTVPELIGKDAFSFLSPHIAEERRLPILEVFRTGKPLRFDDERLGLFFENSLFPVLSSGGTVTAVAVYARDITKRKHAEAALRESEERFRTMADDSPVMLWLAGPGGDCTFLNQGRLEFTGRSLQDELGDKWMEEIHPEDLSGCRSDIATAVAHRDPFAIEYRLRRHDGEYRSVFDRGVPRFDAGGALEGYVGSCIDITDRKRAEELSVQTERLKATAQLATGVAHNFNDLLQIILGSTQIAALHLELGSLSGIKPKLDQVQKSARLGSEMVKRLQSFARLRTDVPAFDRKVFDLSDPVRQALEMGSVWWDSAAVDRGIAITVGTDLASCCYVSGAESELFELALNLIKNATEALPQGGGIRIETRVEGPSVVLRVQDDGVGIPDEHFGRIFEPFFSTKGPQAPGMGLASSYGIVERHRGMISVQSRPEEGTAFTITLPLAAQPVHKESVVTVNDSTRVCRILIIDDMPVVLTALGQGLTKFGHSVLKASSGREGLDIYRSTPVDLVICDLGMPEMSGWSVGKAIKEVCAEIGIAKTPFVLLTGWGGQSSHKERIAESGVDRIEEKPIEIARLADLIAELVGASSTA